MWGEAPFLGKFIEEENSYEEMTASKRKRDRQVTCCYHGKHGPSPDTLAWFLTKTKDGLDCGAWAGSRPWPARPSTPSAEPQAVPPASCLPSPPCTHPPKLS